MPMAHGRLPLPMIMLTWCLPYSQRSKQFAQAWFDANTSDPVAVLSFDHNYHGDIVDGNYTILVYEDHDDTVQLRR